MAQWVFLGWGMELDMLVTATCLCLFQGAHAASSGSKVRADHGWSYAAESLLDRIRTHRGLHWRWLAGTRWRGRAARVAAQ